MQFKRFNEKSKKGEKGGKREERVLVKRHLYSFSANFVFENNKNKQKEAGGWLIFKRYLQLA